VLEVVARLGQVTGLDATPMIEARRPGDPPSVVASVDRIEAELGWRAEADLDEILRSAWRGWPASAGPGS